MSESLGKPEACCYCGQIPDVVPEIRSDEDGIQAHGYRIRCVYECHWAMPRWRQTRAEVIEAWNRVVATHYEGLPWKSPEERLGG